MFALHYSGRLQCDVHRFLSEKGNEMPASQKHAWFNLVVVGVSVLVVLSLYPFLGWGVHGGLGILGALGFGPIFFRKRKDKVVMDERDVQIQRRSVLLGYSVFWVVFVLVASFMSVLFYGQDGSIPVRVVQVSVFYAMVLFIGVMSVATLIQYGSG
jgi:hypothetical protein